MHKLALLAAVSLATVVHAQQNPETLQKEPGEGQATPEVRNEKKLTIEGEVQWVTAYFSDGYNFGDDGLFLQPSLTATYEAYASDNLTISPYANAWANITDQKYEGGDYFDELDLLVGVEFATGPWTFGVEYIYYVSPVNTFDDVHELGLSVGFDDSTVTALPFALNPYAAVYIETVDRGGPEGKYVELGIEPAYEIKQAGITLAFPITTAINIDDFYFDEDGDDELFGYVSGGVVGTYNFNDNWWISAGVEYVYLLADSTEASNDGDNDEWIGKVGIGFSY